MCVQNRDFFARIVVLSERMRSGANRGISHDFNFSWARRRLLRTVHCSVFNFILQKFLKICRRLYFRFAIIVCFPVV